MAVQKFCTDGPVPGCCLHDPEAKEFHCVAETYGGARCKNFAYRTTPYCKLHNKRCSQVYTRYKNVCNHLSNWKQRSLTPLTDKQIESDITTAGECKRLRIDHFIECFKTAEDDYMDPSHRKALDYMDDIIRDGKAELYRRKYKK